jgi:hypothetical protein
MIFINPFIIIHEFCHFLMCKFLKVKILECNFIKGKIYINTPDKFYKCFLICFAPLIFTIPFINIFWGFSHIFTIVMYVFYLPSFDDIKFLYKSFYISTAKFINKEI